MSSLKHSFRNYILYILSCLVIIAASITLVFSLYRLQRDTSLLNRERKRDYVTNKINKSFPTIALIISIIVCILSIVNFIAIFINGRIEILIISIVSNLILGVGLIVLSVIKLGFVQNIVDNFPVDIERLLVDFIVNNKTTARDELLNIENSNDCCTTQDPTWTKQYSQASECNREEKYRKIYADQDEQRGCVKIITRTALSFMPILISEIVCGCLCLLLGVWTIYLVCHINQRYKNAKLQNTTVHPLTETEYPYYPTYKTIQNIIPKFNVIDDQTNKTINNPTITHHSYPSIPFNKTENKHIYTTTVSS